MPTIEKRTVSLPSEQADFIDAKIKAGDHAPASEVVRTGLRALKERDEIVERWLTGEVAASYDAMKADPSRAISVDDAFASVRALVLHRFRSGLFESNNCHQGDPICH